METNILAESGNPMPTKQQEEGTLGPHLQQKSSSVSSPDKSMRAGNILQGDPSGCQTTQSKDLKIQNEPKLRSSSSEESLTKDLGSLEPGHLHAPKRPLSPFIFFSQEERKKIKRESPFLITKNIIKQVEKNWRSMTPEQKKPYEQMSIQNREDYKVKVKAFDQAKLASQAHPERTIIDRIKSRREHKIAQKSALKERRLNKEPGKTRISKKKSVRNELPQLLSTDSVALPQRQIGLIKSCENKRSKVFFPVERNEGGLDHLSCVISDGAPSIDATSHAESVEHEKQQNQFTVPHSKASTSNLVPEAQIGSKEQGHKTSLFSSLNDSVNTSSQKGSSIRMNSSFDQMQSKGLKRNKSKFYGNQTNSQGSDAQSSRSSVSSTTQQISRLSQPNKRQSCQNISTSFDRAEEQIQRYLQNKRSITTDLIDQETFNPVEVNSSEESSETQALPSISDFMRATTSLPRPLYGNETQQQKQSEKQDLVSNLSLFSRPDPCGEYNQKWNEPQIRQSGSDSLNDRNLLRNNLFGSYSNEWQMPRAQPTPVQQSFFNGIEGNYSNYRQQPQYQNIVEQDQFQQPGQGQMNRPQRLPKLNFDPYENVEPIQKIQKMASELQFDIACQSNLSSSSAHPVSPQSNLTSNLPTTPQSSNGPNTFDSFKALVARQQQIQEAQEEDEDDPGKFINQEVEQDVLTDSSLDDIIVHPQHRLPCFGSSTNESQPLNQQDQARFNAFNGF